MWSDQSLKLLIAVDKSRVSYLKPFVNELSKLGMDCKMVDDLSIYGYSMFDKKYFRWIKTPEQFTRIIIDYKPDMVFTERTSHFSLLTIKSKIPLCIFLRGDPWSESVLAKETLYTSKIDRLKIWAKERIAQKCFKKSILILPICRYLENIVRQHYPDKNISTFYQGIDLSEWYQANKMELKHPCVGLLQGAWIWGKTKEMLTLTKVMEAMPDVMFYWAGDGPYRDRILPVLSKYDNFKWLGSLEYPDKVREYLSSIDVYALMSSLDMSPLTLQEAQLMKKPVVATNAGGIPELMMDKETGFLIEKGDHEDWIKKLTLLINDKKLAETMGSSGRKFIEDNFSWEIMAKGFLKIVQENIDKK